MNDNDHTALHRFVLRLGGCLGLIAALVVFAEARAQNAASPFPAFPQQFSLNSPAPAGYPVAVTRPGTVVVDVTASGAPVRVGLQSAGLPPMLQQGSGHVRLSYNVTAADVQRSRLWVVTVSLVPPQQPPIGPYTASGTLQVSAPPADVAAAVAEANAAASVPRGPRGPTAQDLANFSAAAQAVQAQYDQGVRQRQAQREALNQPLVDQLRAHSGSTVSTRGLAPMPVATVPLSVPRTAVSTSPTIVTAPPPPPPPAPIITALQSSQNAALTQAGPQDQLVIVGQHFGNAMGDVVFKVGANTYPTTALPGCWSDTLIVVKVPDISGQIQGPATVWVQLNPASSNAAAFTFTPILEYRHLYWSTDQSLSPGAQTGYSAATRMGSVFHPNKTFGTFGGGGGNDSFMANTTLKAGWVPVGVSFITYGTGLPGGPGGVYLQDSGFSANPATPRMNIRWYFNAFQDIDYGFDMLLAGPRGTPDGLVVP